MHFAFLRQVRKSRAFNHMGAQNAFVAAMNEQFNVVTLLT